MLHTAHQPVVDGTLVTPAAFELKGSLHPVMLQL
jgi:hypothetical protein